MSFESHLYVCLKLRRRIDRKILIKAKWPFKSFIKFRLEVFIATKRIKSFWLEEKKIYSLLNHTIKKIAKKNELIKPILAIQIDTVNHCELKPWWFENLRSYHTRLLPYSADLILQGSFADGQITNYSDVDLVIFYEPYSIEVLKIKEEIEVFLLQVDPLQHHGIFMIDKNTFDFYWQMDLPVEVLSKAKCFTDESYILKIKGVLKENISSFYAVKSTLLAMKEFLGRDYKLVGLWEWKFFLSQLLLLPTLILGSEGYYVYKRDSFDMVRKMVSQKAWHCIDRASEIRLAWPGSAFFKQYENLRNSVTEKPDVGLIKAISFPNISVFNDTRFSESLQALIKETEGLISND
jgi:hypothetical protein